MCTAIYFFIQKTLNSSHIINSTLSGQVTAILVDSWKVSVLTKNWSIGTDTTCSEQKTHSNVWRHVYIESMYVAVLADNTPGAWILACEQTGVAWSNGLGLG